MFRRWLSSLLRPSSDGGQMKLVVGLGNPGRRYQGTRHNVGFQVVKRLAERFGAVAPRRKFEGDIAEIDVQAERVLLLTPRTYMNLSGGSVLAARDFYKLDLPEILVVCDDFQLELGRLRARPKGSAGGQKGLNDVLRRLGSDQVPRMRIGVGSPPPGWDVTDYVLGKFKQDELETIEIAIERATDAAKVWIQQGMAACMNEFNFDASRKSE